MGNVFTYTDYRKYLSDWCEAERERTKSFSFRNFARRAKIKSSGFLKSVMDGDRDLTDDTIEKFVKALGLAGEEARFFADLVHFNQAKTPAEKGYHYKRMMGCRQFMEAHKLDHDSFDYFSKWYYTAIREMVALPDFKEDYGWIAGRLDDETVTADDAKNAVETILRLGLLERDDEGRLVMSHHKLVTDEDIQSVNVTNYHRAMMRRAEESMSKYRAAERNVGAITVAMSEEKFEVVKRRLGEFKRELWALLEETGDAKEVYQINFQLFGLTKGEKE